MGVEPLELFNISSAHLIFNLKNCKLAASRKIDKIAKFFGSQWEMLLKVI